MARSFLSFLIFLSLLHGGTTSLWAYRKSDSVDVTTRIKDVVTFEGVRSNQLVGYGLVIGLNGTGDSLRKSIFTKESLVSMLDRMGVNVRDAGDVDTKNIAAVIVTATLPPFSRQGSSIDVTVSAMGDAKSLLGGTLLVTPLVGADGEVYAVSQGPIATSGFSVKGKASSVTKGVPTTGRIANGAIVEREVKFAMTDLETMSLSLRNPDFTTARRIEEAINKHMGNKCASALDSSTVKLEIPQEFSKDRVALLTKIEQLFVVPDQPARVIVDDHDGIIVMGDKTKVSRVAVSHGSITVRITEEDEVSQPNIGLQLPQVTAINQSSNVISLTSQPNFNEGVQGGGQSAQTLSGERAQGRQQFLAGAGQGQPAISTQVVNRTKIDVSEGEGKMAIVESGASLKDLVNSLNALGATPRDMISILNSIKAAGALQASIEVI